MAHGIRLDLPSTVVDSKGNWSVAPVQPNLYALIGADFFMNFGVTLNGKGTMKFELVKKENGVETVVETVSFHGLLDNTQGPSSEEHFKIRLVPGAASAEASPEAGETHKWIIGPEFEQGSYLQIIVGGAMLADMNGYFESDEFGTVEYFQNAVGTGHLGRKYYFKYESY